MIPFEALNLIRDIPAAGRRRYICGWAPKPAHMDPIATGLRKDIEAPGAMERVEAAKTRRVRRNAKRAANFACAIARKHPIAKMAAALTY